MFLILRRIKSLNIYQITNNQHKHFSFAKLWIDFAKLCGNKSQTQSFAERKRINRNASTSKTGQSLDL